MFESCKVALLALMYKSSSGFMFGFELTAPSCKNEFTKITIPHSFEGRALWKSLAEILLKNNLSEITGLGSEKRAIRLHSN